MRSRYLALILTIAVTFTLLAAGSPAQESKGGSYTKIPTVKGIETLKAGTPAPDFVVKDLGGQEFRLKDCCGNDAVLLFFWSFFCGPGREGMPLISEMTRQYGGKG